MNKLLLRLLKKHLNISNESDIPVALLPFVHACNVALNDMIVQRSRAQHSLHLVSDELLEKCIVYARTRGRGGAPESEHVRTEGDRGSKKRCLSAYVLYGCSQIRVQLRKIKLAKYSSIAMGYHHKTCKLINK